MRHADSLDKVIGVYIGELCAVKFNYKGRFFSPKTIVISPLLVRGFTCPSRCGACCGSFSLDYLPSENAVPSSKSKSIAVNGSLVSIQSDSQKDITDRWCRYLDLRSGRCKAYDVRPLSCDFELIRILSYKDKAVVTQKLYGRAWAMTRIDNEKGTLCEMLPVNDIAVREVSRKFKRLLDWANHIGVQTKIPNILDWIERKNFDSALTIS